jgi:molybdopterin-guanine dinucleotide biosynthesis protein A
MDKVNTNTGTLPAHPALYGKGRADRQEISGVILAGGNSTRMKSNKALLPCEGERFIERIYRKMSDIFNEVILVTNDPESYTFIPCRKVSDRYPGLGALAGIHAGLAMSSTPYVFVVACDMPNLNEAMIRRVVRELDGQDVVIPESDGGLEPLHALYGKGSLPVMEAYLSSGKKKIVDCFRGLRITVISCSEVAAIDPEFHSFKNINTPEEYFHFREDMRVDADGEKDEGYRLRK